MIYYLVAISFFISLFLSFLFWKLGKKYKIYDKATEDPLKIHKESVSCLGGLAMILTISIIFCLKMIFENSFNWQIFAIIIGGFLVFLLGFKDDLKWRDKFRIKRTYKFIFLILSSFLAAIILLSAGLGIKFFPILIIQGFLSFAGIFILINAVNYQDGMDGMAGGTTVISLIGFIILSLVLNNNLAFVISLISIVVILGFLVFNFPPAKIFMGDSGAYFLGFILAVLIMFFSKPYDFSGTFGLMFILGLPLFDGVFTNIRRLFRKRSIFLGDRAHFFDRLHQKGFSIRKTLLICCFIQVIFVILGVSISIL